MRVKVIVSVVCLGVILVMAPVCLAKSWRGLTPLKSTRTEVEQLLGVAGQDNLVSYKLPEETVYINYAPSENWPFRIAPGTVISITIFPRNKIPLTELDLRLSDFRREQGARDVAGESYIYRNELEGFTIETYNGRVTRVTYEPTRREYLESRRRSKRKRR